MTFQGGSSGLGTLVEYDITTNTLTKKADFDRANGYFPIGSLIQASNGKLYGTAYQGGINRRGTVVKYDIAATTLTIKADFTGANGEMVR